MKSTSISSPLSEFDPIRLFPQLYWTASVTSQSTLQLNDDQSQFKKAVEKYKEGHMKLQTLARLIGETLART